MIGIFDSGSGGLSVLAALREKTPEADIVYFGDIKHAPYGSRTEEELESLAAAGMLILSAHGATEIIAACNSISATVLTHAVGHDRVIEMTRPTARMMRSYAGKRVLLLATPATISSGIYRTALWSIVSLDECPVPELAGAIERECRSEEIASIVREALETRRTEKYDTILLGCTHYPLVREVIESIAEDVFGPVDLVDPAEAVAKEAIERFDCTGKGAISFLISQDSHGFRNRIAPYFLYAPCTLSVI